jgi:hypothetical protein
MRYIEFDDELKGLTLPDAPCATPMLLASRIVITVVGEKDG